MDEKRGKKCRLVGLDSRVEGGSERVEREQRNERGGKRKISHTKSGPSLFIYESILLTKIKKLTHTVSFGYFCVIELFF